ncbi:PIG-L family deacetylase [Cellulophaga lytica]|uniref:LmbE family protein n=1 Tax=Cellulophaga lytica (strain ATCC 23178 / DSM 7489 / JCM 8516 / NBRC 14961 / NCIMB 1423 / VKM B-1433 / Cy l20) TaxID=867900 RepID=F0RE18_CELLC|nr:PIG-L family deacetylase [Cellulophaga lytica]ADY30973.1 LmbE family protein [Cellulophaga lytica DSM 7489]WQG78113.1 PIG-L family deacetylase [Cellulophaga lytica]
MRQLLVSCVISLLCINLGFSQAPKKNSSTEIYHSLQKLNFLGSALYIAAHPDDENTRLISYLSNNVKAKTAYLSLTRGDGGQNLIGPEIREQLGVLRTQELLGARSKDGGEQFFSRANDFGYSKHPDETLAIWNKKEVLGDVVQIIRQYKPDVIINRFNHRTPGTTHGHHTTSAMLSVEAFDLVNDANAYPEQLKLTETWQPKRMFFNTSWWFYGSEEAFNKADKSKLMKLDVGVFYPILGVSNNEIAALASSQHLCQGFGRISTRGSQDEYIELLKGDMPKGDDIFEGINTTWSRIDGGDAIGKILNKVEENFNFKNPSSHLPELIEAYKLLQKSTDKHWKNIKSKELENIITAVAGLYLEANANYTNSTPSGNFKVSIEALNRSTANIVLKSVNVGTTTLTPNILLENNTKENLTLDVAVPENTKYTSPYWLMEKGTLGMYTVKDKKLIGKPETPRAFNADFELSINNYTLTITKPVVYHYSKPDKGELYRPFEVLPEASVGIKDKVIIFSDESSKQIPVTVKALADDISGEIELTFSKGWKVANAKQNFNIKKRGDSKTIIFTVTPPNSESEGSILPVVKINGKELNKELVVISYDHIPTQSVLLPSEAKVVRLDIKKTGKNIGYITGAGDKIPESLEQIGYNVSIIDPNNINTASLKGFDAIVVGIRAYNVVDQLKFKQHFLLDYVKNGGNLVIQYNTAGRSKLGVDNIAPYPLELSRDRVTNEFAEVTILAKDHPVVNTPNKITPNDFNNWVQERGLYFPNKWGKEFTPILAMADKGEEAKKGSILIAAYGKGNYVYTGISFFRELPAGVPGAYKLFANLLSLPKKK